MDLDDRNENSLFVKRLFFVTHVVQQCMQIVDVFAVITREISRRRDSPAIKSRSPPPDGRFASGGVRLVPIEPYDPSKNAAINRCGRSLYVRC
jgi:hypothetical protein